MKEQLPPKYGIRVRRSCDNLEKDIPCNKNGTKLNIVELLDFVGEYNGFVATMYGIMKVNYPAASLQPQIVFGGRVFMNGEDIVMLPADMGRIVDLREIIE